MLVRLLRGLVTYLDWLRIDGDISEQALWTSELLVLTMALAWLTWPG